MLDLSKVTKTTLKFIQGKLNKKLKRELQDHKNMKETISRIESQLVKNVETLTSNMLIKLQEHKNINVIIITRLVKESFNYSHLKTGVEEIVKELVPEKEKEVIKAIRTILG